MKKKSISLFLLMSIVFLQYFIPFVNAAYSYSNSPFSSFGSFDIRTGSEDVINFITSFASPFFEAIIGDYSSSEFFLAKCLLLILLFAVISGVIKKVPQFKGNKFVVFIISLVVSVLAIRYMSDNQLINGILLPYGALGAAIIVSLPLIIYFFFVEFNVPGAFGRRAAWILYGILFLVLWFIRFDTMGSVINWIYFLGLIFVLLCLIFDGPIHGYFDTIPLRRGMENYRTQRRAEDWEDYKTLLKYYEETGDEKALAKIKRLSKKFKGLESH